MRLPLSQFADTQIGYQVRGKVVPQAGATHLLVQTADVGADGQIAWERLSGFTPERGGVDRYRLRDGDVLFLAKGAKRVATAVRHPRPHSLAVSTFYVLRVRDDAVCLPEYLAWYLNVAAREEIAAREQRGMTIPFIPKEALVELEVDVPSTATQRRIAALDALTRRERELTARLMDQRSRLVDAVAQRALRGKGGGR